MSPDLKVEVVPVDALEPDPENARAHSEANLRAIAGSLRLFGQRRPLVVYGSTVIAGNGTLEAARSLGWERVAITRVPRDWTVEQARAFALADNRTAELAEWDSRVLADQLVDLDAVGWDVSDFGFEPLTPPTESDLTDAFDRLPDGDRPDATQMTFTLTLRQAEIVKHALGQAKPRASDEEHKNSNGNALALIVEEWLRAIG